MNEAFDLLKQFFLGAAYSVFAVGCALAVIAEGVTYATFFAALILATLLLILSWVCAMAERGA
jgi:hypothetical protein